MEFALQCTPMLGIYISLNIWIYNNTLLCLYIYMCVCVFVCVCVCVYLYKQCQ